MSNLQSCLMWQTERPYIGGKRDSPCFRMFGQEWYLSLYLEKYDSEAYLCSIYMNRKSDSLKTYLSAKCDVIAGSLAFGGNFEQIGKTCSREYLIMSSYPKIADLIPSDSWSTSFWKIFCRFSSNKPLSLHISDEKISLFGDNNYVDECVQASAEIPHDMEALSSDISSLLDKEILPDFKLNCGDHSFPVHRSVLAARSKVFRAMLQNSMKESEVGSADVKDLEVPVLQSMLKFLYSGKLEDISEDTVVRIYEAADKYDVPSLRKACCHWMKRNLSEDNCIGYLSVADSHSDNDLRAGVIAFIVKQPAIFNSPAWMTFSDQNPILANKVFQAYFSPVSQ